MFILVVLFLPGGLVSIPARVGEIWRKRRGAKVNAEVAALKPEYVLTVEDVNKQFDGFKAINNLTFYLEKGELRVVIGPNGAGKSTFFDLLTGRVKPDSGQDRVRLQYRPDRAQRVRDQPPGDRAKVPDAVRLPGACHRLGESPALAQGAARGVCGLFFTGRPRRKRSRIDELLDLIRLGAKRDRMAGETGARGKAVAGNRHASRPRSLRCSWSTSQAAGMTDEETHRTGELLVSLAGKHSLIVIGTRHDLCETDRPATGSSPVLHQAAASCATANSRRFRLTRACARCIWGVGRRHERSVASRGR